MSNGHNPAFPICAPTLAQHSTGLSKREFMATKVAEGICARVEIPEDNQLAKATIKEIAKTAVQVADAILTEIGKKSV